MDVRPKVAFDLGHIPGSASVPLYQPIDFGGGGNVAEKALRFVAYTFNGVR